MTRRGLTLAVIVGLLLAMLAAKSVAVFLSAMAMRPVAENRRLVAPEAPLSTDALAAELSPLEDALFWSPGDADLLYQYARDLHRLAAAGYALAPAQRQQLAARFGLQAEAESRMVLLSSAIVSYERAAQADALVSGARLWRLAALVMRDGADRAAWSRTRRAEVLAALRYDPDDPALWRAAGDLALDHRDTKSAAEWYRHSLRYKLDGLDAIVARLSLELDGNTLIAATVPRTAEALRRLAQYDFNAWRFADARAAFAEALRLDGSTPQWPRDSEALSDGEFNQDEHRLLHPWIVGNVAGVTVERMTEAGQVFLAADFVHGPDNWYHVYQNVPVEPGRRYRLSARVRVKGFVADDQFGVEAVHPYAAELFTAAAKCLASAADRPGAGAPPISAGRFVTVSVDLTAPDNLRLLVVRLRRWAPNSGTGRVDFAAVSLRLLEN